MEKTDVDVLSGNELIIQGALEANFSLYTGYPGSPLADFFNILHNKKSELNQRGIKVVIANSEANAAAMISGAKMAGQNALLGMKSMGLHVASDALSVGNFADSAPVRKEGELAPGQVIVVGDDPWSLSTSTPADSRYLFKHLHIPFLEPGNPQELKDWIKKALEISQKTTVYQGVLLTTAMAEGGGRVEIGEINDNHFDPVELDPKKFDLSKNVMVPPNSLHADKRMIEERFPKVEQVYSEMNLDQVFGNEHSQIGFLTAGYVSEMLLQVLEDESLFEKVSVYKLASSYPLTKNLLSWVEGKKTIYIVEEKRGFLENEFDHFCRKNEMSPKVVGKDLFPAFGGISYEILQQKLRSLFPCEQRKGEVFSLAVPMRPPTFCPGCPHRETLSLLKDLRKTLEGKNLNLISHGDVGCYSLSFLPPFKEMHDLSAMGQGGAMAGGTDLFTLNPSVVLMGDSTFFHSGVSAISNSLQMGHDITYILLDNDNTAMTGHQMTPASGLSVDGYERSRQKMLSIVQGMGVETSLEVNPSDRYFYQNILNDFVLKKGVKVIVSNKECGLTFHSRLRKKERSRLNEEGQLEKKTFFQINSDACEDCKVCVEMTGCPGLSRVEDAYGFKMSIDPQICVSDSYCTKLKVCPSFEKVDVFQYSPGKGLNESHLTKLSSPKTLISFEEISNGKDWRIVVSGVGGSGVTTLSKILSKASLKMGGREDIDFKFFDQKGLAQRNGSVVGHLSFSKKGRFLGTTTPVGMADIVVSPDLLEGIRCLRFLRETGFFLCDEETQVPLSSLLNKGDEKSFESYLKECQKNLRERMAYFPFKKLSYQEFGKSVYASTMLLGYLFQKGFLPFEESDLLEAFPLALPKREVENNIKAFQLGREVVEGRRYREKKEETKDYLLSIVDSLSFFESKDHYLQLFYKKTEEMKTLFPLIPEDYLKQYLHDLMIYDRFRKIDSYLNDCKKIQKLYTNDDLALALRVLTKTYFIKDEVFVSHQMISPLKKKRDKSIYENLGESYKVTHINRPSFDIWGRKIEFDLTPKEWMLRIMRHMRFLRKALRGWHQREGSIANTIRGKILEGDMSREKLLKLDHIKGYRNVRYEKFDLL